ncbi:MAG: hypothetical protein J5882_07345 [Bacteroidales bacterium]|nr:hypothetical protein [Bacteroidales bacterium]
MKRIFSTIIASTAFASTVLADTLPYYGDSVRNVQFFPADEFVNNQSALSALEHEQSLNIIYIVSLVVLIIIAVAVWYLQNLKNKQYSKIVLLQNEELQRTKYQSDMFGYVLNAAQFPCCLVDAEGNISWCNEAFATFYGRKSGSYDIFSGTDGEFDRKTVGDATVPTTFHVRIKDTYGKVFGFKRTVVPLKNSNGTKDYAVVENIAV